MSSFGLCSEVLWGQTDQIEIINIKGEQNNSKIRSKVAQGVLLTLRSL